MTHMPHGLDTAMGATRAKPMKSPADGRGHERAKRAILSTETVGWETCQKYANCAIGQVRNKWLINGPNGSWKPDIGRRKYWGQSGHRTPSRQPSPRVIKRSMGANQARLEWLTQTRPKPDKPVTARRQSIFLLHSHPRPSVHPRLKIMPKEIIRHSTSQ